MMCHNGEINTLRGNKNWMYSRGGIMESKYFGSDTTQLLPVTSGSEGKNNRIKADFTKIKHTPAYGTQ